MYTEHINYLAVVELDERKAVRNSAAVGEAYIDSPRAFINPRSVQPCSDHSSSCFLTRLSICHPCSPTKELLYSKTIPPVPTKSVQSLRAG